MADYTGKNREYYNIRRQLESRLKSFEKAGIAPPAALRTDLIRKIMETSPAKADSLLKKRAGALKQQFKTHKYSWTPKGVKKNEEALLKRLSAPPEQGGLGYTNITAETKDLFFQFMDYVRTKFESMQFDSDIYAAAANEMIGQVKRRNVDPAQIKQHFERFAEQAIKTTEGYKKLSNYSKNFNALARRLGL